ncbi:MAG: hypothetical protein IT416_01490 [Candidatus Pacebacteria bacterium]|nr:hypothetical protein [Candidatus Paceibacterota bacterium]
MKKLTKISTAINTFLLGLFLASPVKAEITNPVVSGKYGSGSKEAASGSTFAEYFIFFWNALISIGAITVLIFFVWGAIEWIGSGGDKGKVENARNRITQAVIGLVVLVGSYAIIGFIGEIFFGDTFSVLQINVPDPN